MRSQILLSPILLVLLALVGHVYARRVIPSFGDITLKITGADGSDIRSETLTSPPRISKPLTLGSGSKLTLNVPVKDDKGKALSLQHLFLGARNDKTRDEKTLVCASKGTGVFTCELDQSTLDKLHPGPHTLTLYAGSVDTEPLAHKLGTAEFSIAGPSTKGSSDWDVFQPLPEITHKFRPADKMPNKILSLTFSGLVLAPWLLLLGSYIVLGANFTNLFSSSVSFISGSAFMGSLSLCVLLYYVYWVKLNLFQLLGYGSLLGLITAILGRQALVARAAMRSAGVPRSVKTE
ncbi:uncharacterized protein SPPG_02342 [Spizellomyces punctatus DAOM BR117]|uniref:Ribophorin II C-terminal domain-containing protein n=1 Tax=Spizellomyces punctatus (strain DAOM BR117) TaxID=645134 RepID=A0A0L0HQF5_SPIPD|nr:uncharacterized protein SPPG_02342 [Spizellomyces punctatus DAOM BR117]KND03293.1 hypothetical protein SPPG_02342 [Spizellomyces punctatus DAOM BR117]|eukprot:XP_016611332.1 hypothetical protein SPPG_02342 [Spizellomyces punctatus DAOM BR117]